MLVHPSARSSQFELSFIPAEFRTTSPVDSQFVLTSPFNGETPLQEVQAISKCKQESAKCRVSAERETVVRDVKCGCHVQCARGHHCA